MVKIKPIILFSIAIFLVSCSNGKRGIFKESTRYSVDATDITQELEDYKSLYSVNSGLTLRKASGNQDIYATYGKNGFHVIGKYDIQSNEIIDLISGHDLEPLLVKYTTEYDLSTASLNFIDVYHNKLLFHISALGTWVSEQLIVSYDLASKAIDLVYLYPISTLGNSYAPQLIYGNYMYLDIINDAKVQTEIIRIDLDTKVSEVYKEKAQLPLTCFQKLCYFRLEDDTMVLYDEEDKLIGNLGSHIDRYSILGTDDALYFNSYFSSAEKDKAIQKIKANGNVNISELENTTDYVPAVTMLSKLDASGVVTDLIVRHDESFMQFPRFDGRFVTISMFGSWDFILYDTISDSILGGSLNKDDKCASYAISTDEQFLIQ